jgi:arylsulfatase A-like enzyme
MHEHDNVFNHGLSVYDTEILTPLILRFPHGKYGGRRVSRLVSNIDVMPTILDFLGLSIPNGIEGESFAAVVEGSMPPRAPLFAEATMPWDLPKFDDNPVWPNNGKYQCIRTERYKFMVRATDEQFRFYDILADPQEQNNLLEEGQEYDAAVLADLRERLMTWRDDADPVESEQLTTRDHIEALRSLGYIGGGN